MRLLIIEDEIVFAENVKRLLQPRGFVADIVDNAEKALERLRLYHRDYAAVLLDIALRGMDGIELIRVMRAERMRIPVVVISSHADAPMKVKALDAGADDYLSKPFSGDELNARLRALLRRPQRDARRGHTHEPRRVGALTVDAAERDVFSERGRLSLTGREFAIFEHLATHPNRTVTTGDIRRALWGDEAPSGSNVLSVHIKNLRRKLRPHGARIETIRGIGYRLVA